MVCVKVQQPVSCVNGLAPTDSVHLGTREASVSRRMERTKAMGFHTTCLAVILLAR